MAVLALASEGLAIFGLILFVVLWLMHFMSIIYTTWHLALLTSYNWPWPMDPGCSDPFAESSCPPAGQPGIIRKLTDSALNALILIIDKDHDDPAIDVCKKLLGKYPNVDARLFIGGKKVGINPKINNLMPGYEVAKYDLIWICDSGIRVTPDTLTDMANQMTEKVGLVHGLPYVADRQGFAATLEQVYFGTSHPRSYISANLTGFKCVTGMSCLMRKDVLDQAGGLIAFAQYIAEDYFMAKAIADRGWKFAMATQVAMQNSGSYSISQFQSRMIRWAKLRINMLPATIICEPISECFVASLVIGWAAHHVFRWDIMVFFMCHCLAWFIFDYIQLKGVQEVLVHIEAKLGVLLVCTLLEDLHVERTCSSLEDKCRGSRGAMMATILLTTSQSVPLLPCLGRCCSGTQKDGAGRCSVSRTYVPEKSISLGLDKVLVLQQQWAPELDKEMAVPECGSYCCQQTDWIRRQDQA
ncbi:hypothetical protein DUI87_28828 [Hirundo rustica rustica]|uniref:ceramide glucosyltransferase n=1 Tax=Hirundo rustica rustica TaxID=333673 RepID=A0A3M0J1J3_HIRRU|nr:hypothetical protein DUI87_28828 [Hirundo rustica rustica]